MAAVITAIITFVIFLLTKIWELISRILDDRQKLKFDILSLKAELMVNKDICEMILGPGENIRTLGLLPMNNAWLTINKSVLFSKGIPGEQIIKVYTKIHQYYLLVNRREAIQKQRDYPNAQQVIELERSEMQRIVEEVVREIDKILKIMKSTI